MSGAHHETVDAMRLAAVRAGVREITRATQTLKSTQGSLFGDDEQEEMLP